MDQRFADSIDFQKLLGCCRLKFFDAAKVPGQKLCRVFPDVSNSQRKKYFLERLIFGALMPSIILEITPSWKVLAFSFFDPLIHLSG